MTTTQLPPQYDPAAIEGAVYQRWLDAEVFRADADSQRDPYVIVIPPPNVTAVLHMGHGLNNTMQDVLIRFERMRGRAALWLPGTDHAGIATQNMVERLLAAEGTDRQTLGREAFVERVWAYVHDTGNRILDQLKAIGASLDWSRTRFTFDEAYSHAVRKVFVDLYHEGLLYRGHRVIHWCPRCLTALSDEEAEFRDHEGHLWYIRYPVVAGDDDDGGYVTVATTRPETMFGDVALVFHPDDERFQRLRGASVTIPLTDVRIPLTTSTAVERDFGTGLLKVTPAHDANDFEIAQALEETVEHPVILTAEGRMAHDARVPAGLQGMGRDRARTYLVELLLAQGLLEKTDDYRHAVRHCYRCDTVVEPRLSDQWFVRMTPLAQPALEAYRTGAVRFVPERWGTVYENWLTEIRDWNISRQLWWGHRIPAWYCEREGCEHITVTLDEPGACEACGGAVRQDEDVLDTWFSSWLWPFATLGWPEETADLRRFYPGHTLVTGPDIIFFWVARMVMMGLKFMGDVPFRVVYIHGLVRDHEGQKMSKSKGNVLDPIDLIDGIDLDTLLRQRTEGMMQPHLKAKVEKATKRDFPDGIQAYGTDALRMTMASLATTGRDINFDLGRIEGYRNFCNKLWNAAHYVFTNIDAELEGEPELAVADRWIRSRLNETIVTVEEAIAGFRLDLAAQALYEFTWHELCDWYLELTKPVLNDATASPAAQLGARQTLRDTLGALLRLLHPIMPFVTEELWLELCNRTGQTSATVMLEPLPSVSEFSRNEQAEDEIAWLKDFVIGVRQIRGEMNISPGKRLSVLLADVDPSDRERLDRHRDLLRSLGRLEAIEILEGDEPDGIATALVRQFRILVPLADLIDIDAERARLGKQRQRIEQDLAKAHGKLGNERFIANAPETVVQKERDRAADLSNQLKSLDQQLARL